MTPPTQTLDTPHGTDVTARAVDLWDATAHLESEGISASVARRLGYRSVFDLARHAEGTVTPDRTPGAPRVEPRMSLVGAFQRSLMMLAGVAICVTTLPTGVAEGMVFVIAAAGWMASQVVSAAIWFGWSRGQLADGVRAALTIGYLVLALGIVGAIASGQWSVLVWVGWAMAIPILQNLVGGWLLTVVVVAGAEVVGLAWLSAERIWWPQPAADAFGLGASLVLTLAAVAVATLLSVRTVRAHETQLHPGTAAAVGVAGLQTAAQLVMLLVIFLSVGPEGFGSVAIAALAAGVLADPLFVAARVITRRVTRRSTSWFWGRTVIGVAGTIAVLVMVVAAGQAAIWLMASPYRIFLNREVVLMSAMVVAAVIAATNVMLRTGSAIGSMVVSVVATLVVIATYVVALDEQTLAFGLLIGLIILVAMAIGLAASRLARPASW